MITVDTRWVGNNGIGRYAKEIIPRLSVPWVSLGRSGRPSSVHDFFSKRLTHGGQVPDAVYSPGYNAFASRVRQTITLHDLIHLDGPNSARYRPYYELLLRSTIKRNGHVLTVSDTSKRRIEQWLNDPRIDVINAGNGCSEEFSTSGEVFEGERPYFLYVGNLKAHKNVETLVHAMASLEGRDLYIATAAREAAKTLAAKYHVSDRVRIVSEVSDVELAALYRGAVATVQPSKIEGFGLPALESALCGTPVVYYAGCESVDEICSGGGYPVEGLEDPQQWSKAMDAISCGERFPRTAVDKEKYSWDRVASTVSLTLQRYA